MMSGLFLGMLAARRGLRGQSPWIAAAKLVGTGLAALSEWRSGSYAGAALMTYLYVANFVVDLAYLAAVILVARATVGDAVRVPAGGAPS